MAYNALNDNTNSYIKNADKISLSNAGTNNLSQGLFTGSAGGISVNGAVGILNLNRNASTTITSNLTAKDLTISNHDGGQSEQEILQGGFGLAAANVSHGALNVTGTNNIKIAGGTLDATTLNISNSDDSKINVNSKGVTVSAGRAIGVLIAEGSFKGSNEIEINNATLNGDTISIKATAAPEVSVDALALSAGAAFAGSGLFAGSINDSAAKISGTGAIFAGVISNPSATANLSAKEITADDLKITATADSTPEISVKGLSVGAIASGSNLIISARDVKVDAALNADSATINNLDIDAKTNSAPNLNVNGDGGISAARSMLKIPSTSTPKTATREFIRRTHSARQL